MKPPKIKANTSAMFFFHEPLCLLGDGVKITLQTLQPTNISEILFGIDHMSIKAIDEIFHDRSHPCHALLSTIINPSSAYVIEKMAHGFNRMGKAHGKGFYNYDTDPPTLWAGLKVFEKRNVNIPEQDILDRLLFATVIGALQTSEEEATGIDPELKTYIPPEWPLSRQQALSWIDNYGEERFATRLAELAAAYGKRFSDPRKEQPSV